MVNAPTTETEELLLAKVRLLLAVCGVAALSYGSWLWWKPAGFITGGALALFLALLGEWAAVRRK